MKSILTVLVSAVLLMVMVSTLIAVDGLIERTANADAGVVLGSKVETDGTPSPRLRARLDRSRALFENGQISFIVVSGGTGKEGFSEALVMRDYLVKEGIPANQILLDEFGATTRATADNVTRILREKDMDTAIVVSQFFHLTRSKMAFRQAGFEKVGSAYAPYFELRDFYSTLREIPALIAYGLRMDSTNQPRDNQACLHRQALHSFARNASGEIGDLIELRLRCGLAFALAH